MKVNYSHDAPAAFQGLIMGLVGALQGDRDVNEVFNEYRAAPASNKLKSMLMFRALLSLLNEHVTEVGTQAACATLMEILSDVEDILEEEPFDWDAAIEEERARQERKRGR